VNKPFFTIHFFDVIKNIISLIRKVTSITLLWASLFACLLVIYHVGFYLSPIVISSLQEAYNFLIVLIFFASLLRLVLMPKNILSVNRWIAHIALVLLLFLISSARVFYPSYFFESGFTFIFYFSNNIIVFSAFVLVFLIEASRSSLELLKPAQNPATLIIFSFLFLIVFGTAMLMLPKATNNGISFVNAVFTSTSAVCVTGLVVIDTATAFTPFGKVILIILIQLGGLGIMTFSTFFGLFFKGNLSFKNQLFLKDMLNETNLSGVFKSIIKIVVFTFVIEVIGIALIFATLDSNLDDKLFVSVFHSVSAFCNAGFSTFSYGLMQEGLSTNYALHFVIAILVVVGGVGFPVAINFYQFIKQGVKKVLSRVFNPSRAALHIPNPLTTSTRLVFYTTLALIVLGSILIAISEWNGSLAHHTFFGKIVSVLFASITPRTAGFNTIDYSAIGFSAIFITLVLMWIGASPGSTGGGIKTTTLALAFLTAFSVARGKDHVEYGRVEFPAESIRRAFAVIFISLLIIGASVFFLMLFEQGRIELLPALFECVSAFSTVGLTMGVTPSLSIGGKWVIIFAMFIGRLGVLTLLIGVFRKVTFKSYRYPTENIYIN
jgi:trk system potassium uptake protein